MQGLGALIWEHRSRPDVGFLIKKMPGDLILAFADVGKAIALTKLYNQIAEFMKKHVVEIHYAIHTWSEKFRNQRFESF